MKKDEERTMKLKSKIQEEELWNSGYLNGKFWHRIAVKFTL